MDLDTYSVLAYQVFLAQKSLQEYLKYRIDNHGVKWYERRANGKAVKYFNKYKNISFWDETEYPITMPIF